MKKIALVATGGLVAAGLTAAVLVALPRGSAEGAAACAAPTGPHMLDAMRADDGLYLVPGLLAPTAPALRDTAYGLAALRSLGRHPHVTASPAQIRSLAAADPTRSPVWTRWYLLQIQQATGTRLLDVADRAALLRLVGSDGSVHDPTIPAGSGHDVEQMVTTSAAVEVLRAAGAPADGPLTRTASWLLAAEQAPSTHPYVEAARQTALGLLGHPEGVGDAARAAGQWYARLRTSGPGDVASVALDLSGYVRLLAMAQIAVPATASAWFRPLFARASSAPDVQTVAAAAAAWARLALPRAEVAPTERRISASLTLQGLVREQAVRMGSVDASEAAERLLGGWGRDTCDVRLRAALVQVRDRQWDQWDGVTRGRWVVAAKAAGYAAWDAPRLAALRALEAEQPGRVDVSTAALWATTADLLTRLGDRPRPPVLVPWDVRSRAGALAAAQLVVAVNDAGLRRVVPRWLAAAPFPTLARQRAAAGDTAEAVTLLSAHLALGHSVPAGDGAAVAALVRSSRGCPGLRNLVRAAPRDRVCDLRTTLAVVNLHALAPTIDLGREDALAPGTVAGSTPRTSKDGQ